MDSIRFEPSVSATFAIDRNANSGGGDLFADMLGDHMKKRADADRPEPITRRKAQAERPFRDEDRPAPRRNGAAIKHAHELRDVATTARDVTPQEDKQPCLAGPTGGSGACMDDQATTDEPTVETSAQDKDQQTDQQAPVAAPATAQAADPETDQAIAIAITIDPQAPVLTEDPVSIEAAADTPTIVPEEPADPVASGEVQPQDAAAQDSAAASLATKLAASLGDTVVGLMAGDDAANAAANAEILASANAAALAAPKAATTGAAEASQAAAVELAAKVTPEAPRPAAETKPRAATRATPNTEIKAQPATSIAPHASAPIQPAVQTATVPALGETPSDGFDPAFSGEGAATPGWALHLAQGAGAKRPDFIAQLRQHLQELPAHEQVAVNIQRAMRAGINRMTIELSPAELGKIHVKLEIDEEKRVTAAVTVEKPSTLELLQRDGKALERALQDAGLKMEGSDLSFSLARQNGEGFAEDMKRSGPAGFGDGSGEAEADPDPSATPAAALVDTAAGLVNVQI